MSDVINFYRLKEPYGQFSNFWKCDLLIDGKVWPTSEHYFQAMKFLDTDIQERVRLCKTPKESAIMGRDRSLPLREDWDEISYSIMYRAVYEKFTQHEDLQKILLSTGDSKIAEHTVNDSLWGDGGDGSGRNRLGRILVNVREDIKKRNEAKIVETFKQEEVKSVEYTSKLRKDIESAINCNSAENGCDTPDFILAEYLVSCLKAFDTAVNTRSKWYGYHCNIDSCNHCAVEGVEPTESYRKDEDKTNTL